MISRAGGQIYPAFPISNWALAYCYGKIASRALCLASRQGAVAYFGNLLKLFSDIPEAIKYIGEFLNNDTESYKMTIDTGDSTIFDIIEEIGEGKNNE